MSFLSYRHLSVLIGVLILGSVLSGISYAAPGPHGPFMAPAIPDGEGTQNISGKFAEIKARMQERMSAIFGDDSGPVLQKPSFSYNHRSILSCIPLPEDYDNFMDCFAAIGDES